MPLVLTDSRLEVPSFLLEDLLSVHPAFDTESGHFVCHSSPLRVVVAKSRRGLVPLVQVSSCTYVTLGEDNLRLVVEEADEEAPLVVRSPDIVEAGSARVHNREVLEILAGLLGYQMRVYSLTIDGSRGVAVVLRGEASAVAIIALSCEEARREEVMHV